jgi:hypothetical protein
MSEAAKEAKVALAIVEEPPKTVEERVAALEEFARKLSEHTGVGR